MRALNAPVMFISEWLSRELLHFSNSFDFLTTLAKKQIHSYDLRIYELNPNEVMAIDWINKHSDRDCHVLVATVQNIHSEIAQIIHLLEISGIDWLIKISTAAKYVSLIYIALSIALIIGSNAIIASNRITLTYVMVSNTQRNDLVKTTNHLRNVKQLIHVINQQ